MDDIKQQLLKEANQKVDRYKEAALQKEGMSYWVGDKDYNHSEVNFRVFERPTGKKIDQIKEEIQNTFAAFMKERTAALSPEFSESGQPEARATKRTVIVPQLAETATKRIDLSVDQSTMQIPGFPKAAGAQNGSLYFRWAWKRTILPSNGGPEEAKAKTLIEELNNDVDPKFEIHEFIKDMEQLRMPLLPYYNAMDLDMSSDPVTKHLIHFSREPLQINGQQAPNPLRGVAGQLEDFNRQKRNQRWQAITLSNRSKPLTFGNDDVKLFTSHSILVRCLFYKIIAGYTLNTESLRQEILGHVRDRIIQLSEKGYDMNRDQKAKIRAEWQIRYIKMVRMFKEMESIAPKEWMWQSGKEGKKIPSVATFIENQPVFADDVADQDRFKLVNYMGLLMKGRSKGTKPNPKAMALDYKYFGTDSLQRLLMHTTQPAPKNRQQGAVQIADPNTFTDPTHKIKYNADGISDSTINELSGQGQTTIGLPPLRKVAEKDVARLHAEGEVLDPRHPVAFDIKSCNMGGGHSAKLGPAVAQMAKKYGEWAQASWANLRNVFQDRQNNPQAADQYMSEEFAQMFELIDKGFFGAEVFQRNLQKHQTPQDYQSWVQTQQTKRIDKSTGQEYYSEDKSKLSKPLNVDPQTFKYLQTYGYWVSKMMDFLSALTHKSCKGTVTIKNEKTGDEQTITRYGQNLATSGGVGGGGEILLSIKYAYDASVKDFLGTPDAERAYKQQKQQAKMPGPYQNIPVRQPTPSLISPDEQQQQEDMIAPGITPQSPAILFSEHMTFWLGASSAIASEEHPDFGTAVFQKRAASNSWNEIVDALHSRFPMLEEEVGDVIPEININMEQLQRDVKKVIAGTRDQIKAEGAEVSLQNAVVYKTSEGEVYRFESGHISEDDATETQEEEVQEEISAFDPDQPATVPQEGFLMPVQGIEEESVTAPGAEQYTYNFPEQPMEPQKEMAKPMEMDTGTPDFIGKDKGQRRLIRHGPDVMTGKLRPASVIDRLVTIANKLDDHGEKDVANKVDYVLRYLKGQECLKKEQSLQAS